MFVNSVFKYIFVSSIYLYMFTGLTTYSIDFTFKLGSILYIFFLIGKSILQIVDKFTISDRNMKLFKNFTNRYQFNLRQSYRFIYVELIVISLSFISSKYLVSNLSKIRYLSIFSLSKSSLFNSIGRLMRESMERFMW
jgi:hypothetical protein